LTIDLPGSEVDVNVHPAKAEVRFKDRWQVQRVVEGAVRRALGNWETAPGIRTWSPIKRDATAVDVAALRQNVTGTLFARPLPGDGSSSVDGVLGGPAGSAADDFEGSVAPGADGPAFAEAVHVPVLQQLRRTWLLAESDDGVLLIDQHSAHERVLYERFMGALERGSEPAQRLLFPLTMHLSPAEAEAFEQNRDLLVRLGFEVEGFGGDTLIVNAVPFPHTRFDAPRCLRETLAELAGDRDSSAHARHERLAATVACKAAIKAGDSLSPAEMRGLYSDLARTKLAPHDVHGRATIVLLSWDELERRFGRQ